MAMGYYELKAAQNGQTYFVLKAANHEVILSSQMYKAKASAVNGIESVQENSSDDSLYERKESSNGKDYFVIKAKNHQIIGQSQMYESKEAMENGIASVKKNGPSEVVKDLETA